MHRIKILLGILLLAFIIMALYLCKNIDNGSLRTVNGNEEYVVYDHPEDWRINDINTYVYMIHDILDPFNDGILEEKLWVTDNFREKYGNGEFELRVSIGSDIFDEWYRVNIETGEDTSLIDNNQQVLDKGNFYLYTEIHGVDLLQEKKYTFRFAVDKDNKLDTLEIVNIEIVKDYDEITNNNLELFKAIIQDVNADDNRDLSKYCDNEIITNDFDFSDLKLNDSRLKLLEIKSSSYYSEYDRLLYDIKVENDGLVKYYGFAVILNYNDKIISKAYIDFKSSWGELTKEQYYNPNVMFEPEW